MIPLYDDDADATAGLGIMILLAGLIVVVLASCWEVRQGHTNFVTRFLSRASGKKSAYPDKR